MMLKEHVKCLDNYVSEFTASACTDTKLSSDTYTSSWIGSLQANIYVDASLVANGVVRNQITEQIQKNIQPCTIPCLKQRYNTTLCKPSYVDELNNCNSQTSKYSMLIKDAGKLDNDKKLGDYCYRFEFQSKIFRLDSSTEINSNHLNFTDYFTNKICEQDAIYYKNYTYVLLNTTNKDLNSTNLNLNTTTPMFLNTTSANVTTNSTQISPVTQQQQAEQGFYQNLNNKHLFIGLMTLTSVVVALTSIFGCIIYKLMNYLRRETLELQHHSLKLNTSQNYSSENPTNYNMQQMLEQSNTINQNISNSVSRIAKKLPMVVNVTVVGDEKTYNEIAESREYSQQEHGAILHHIIDHITGDENTRQIPTEEGATAEVFSDIELQGGTLQVTTSTSKDSSTTTIMKTQGYNSNLHNKKYTIYQDPNQL